MLSANAENHNVKSCKQRLVCRLCFELCATEMHNYLKRRTNEDHDNAQPGISGTGAVKYASVNRRFKPEFISIVAVWVGRKSSRKMVKTDAVLDNCSSDLFHLGRDHCRAWNH